MKLQVSSPAPDPEQTVFFRLEQDGRNVVVYADNTLLGWFEVYDGKIRFGTAFIPETGKAFVSHTKNQLTVY